MNNTSQSYCFRLPADSDRNHGNGLHSVHVFRVIFATIRDRNIIYKEMKGEILEHNSAARSEFCGKFNNCGIDGALPKICLIRQ